GMEGGLPAPTIRLFRREASVFVPSFVEELVGTVRQIAPSQRRDRINHLAEFGLRLLHPIKRISKSFLRPLPFDCNPGDVPCRLDQFEIVIVANSCLRTSDGEGT